MDENCMLDAAALLCALRRISKVGKTANVFTILVARPRVMEIPILGFLDNKMKSKSHDGLFPIYQPKTMTL